MLELQDVFTRFGAEYRSTHFLSSQEFKAMDAIESCRTNKLGGHKDVCDSCDNMKISYNSCGNRNCPKCGNIGKEQWILARNSEILPVTYFHTVFTVPHILNPLFLANKEVMYSLLFKAAWDTLAKLALDKKHLGAQIGVTMVLHTWGQNLSFHPHVHCIIPGGGLSLSGNSFVHSKKKFFIHVRIISKEFRKVFLALLAKEFHAGSLSFAGDCITWEDEQEFTSQTDALSRLKWVVYCKKPFKNSYNIVEYLSRYTHKTAIYNNRLVSMDDSKVTFRWRDYKDANKVKLLTLDAMEFIRRFLMHVLPSGFQKIRYYGILSCRCRKTKLARCFKLNSLPAPKKVKLTAKELILKVFGVDISVCPLCGGKWVSCSSLQPSSG